MSSPLETRLRSQIATAGLAEAKGCLTVELACYLARIGEFTEAESIRVDLRQAFGDGRNLQISVLLMCLDALLLYFRDLSTNARDRMLRAQLISKAAKQSSLIALTSSWLAHIDFNQGRYEEMAAAIEACLESLGQEDAAANCRVSVVIADALLYAGEGDASQVWYEKARRAAGTLGDQATIGAITYNRAALRIQATRLQSLRRSIDASEVNRLKSEVQTAVSYQAIAHLKSLDHLLSTSQIGIYILQANFSDAVPVISRLLSSGEIPIGSGQEKLLNSDLARIQAEIGQLDGARASLRSFEVAGLDACEFDDQAIAYGSLSTAARICGFSDKEADYRARMHTKLEADKLKKIELSRFLSKFVAV